MQGMHCKEHLRDLLAQSDFMSYIHFTHCCATQRCCSPCPLEFLYLGQWVLGCHSQLQGNMKAAMTLSLMATVTPHLPHPDSLPGSVWLMALKPPATQEALPERRAGSGWLSCGHPTCWDEPHTSKPGRVSQTLPTLGASQEEKLGKGRSYLPGRMLF